TLFSGFYLALFVLLAVLIVRGVALEFRSKREDAAWRKRWDWALSITSILAPVLLGVAFANLLEGVPIDGSQNFVGTFWDLFSPFSVLAGLMVLSGFLYHGAMFLKIKTSDPIMGRADKLGKTLWITTMVLALVVVGFVLFSPTMNSGKGALPTIIALLGFVAVAISGIVNTRKDSSLPFWLTTLSIVFLSAAFFMYMFPNVMISSLDPNYLLTIYNVASSAKTLQIMSLVAAFGVPIVLLYQGWSYWIFRKRLTEKPSDLHY
ncbi:MAG TPA: cytochrome d ubiquinol oxidase subunit II, partial [Bellilinea sp.]|nr:cytochrome d ubiquinol oxidase subunit II [Bellilinea sp.]